MEESPSKGVLNCCFAIFTEKVAGRLCVLYNSRATQEEPEPKTLHYSSFPCNSRK